jgi:SAM-dependent methyltransferase
MFQREAAPADAQVEIAANTGPRVLNVGGNSKQIAIPGHYDGWTHLLLDIDPSGSPDIVCDARDLASLDAQQFDAVYCSHNLEHYYKHDAANVLRGFLHVLKPEGFAEIRVPDLLCVMKHVVATGMDIEDTLYVSPAGPITVRDVIYGFGKQIEESGVDFYAHKTGFTPTTLSAFLGQAGFGQVFVQASKEAFEIRAVAFKGQATPAQRTALAV